MAKDNIDVQKKKKKKIYELNKHFQDTWAVNLPWVEFALSYNNKVAQV
jgi:hypothetical protein